MKSINTGRYALLLAISGLLLSFGCAKEQALDTSLVATEQAPESIKLEISVKDERQKTSVKAAEEAPKTPVVAKKNCTPRTAGNAANTSPWGGAMGGQQYGSQYGAQYGGQNGMQGPNNLNNKAGSPWGLGNGNNQWGGMGAGQQWPSLAQNNQWGGSQNLSGQSQWPTAASSAPVAPTVVDATADCIEPGYAGGFGGAPGLPGVGVPPPFGPAAPFFNPYGPYFVADVIASDDDGFGRRHHNSGDDEHISDDDHFSDDDSGVNDDDL